MESVSYKYQRRSNDDRCEGFFEMQASSSLRLVSFYQGNASGALAGLSSGNVYQIRALQRFSEPVTVKAIPYSLDVYYQMDARLPLNGSLRWPLNEVLLQTTSKKGPSINPDKLGLIGTLKEQEGGPVYVPLTCQGQPAPDDPLYWVMHAPSPLNSVSWTLLRAQKTDEKCVEGTKEGSGTLKDVKRDKFITINLPNKRGRYHLSIVTQEPDHLPSPPICYVIVI